MRNFKKGFTLIEVVIVLAIAALIMVIVFLAVAGAQRAQRDTATKDAAAHVLAAAEQFAGNSSGVYPTSTMPAGYTSGVVASNGNTPVYAAATSTATSTNRLVYASSATCTGGTAGSYVATSDTRKVSVSYWSETANAAGCIQN